MFHVFNPDYTIPQNRIYRNPPPPPAFPVLRDLEKLFQDTTFFSWLVSKYKEISGNMNEYEGSMKKICKNMTEHMQNMKEYEQI